MDLSQPFDTSVNDYVPPEKLKLKYVTVNGAVKMTLCAGKWCKFAKLDVENAFRLVPVRREDWNLLEYEWSGRYYFDVVLAFGLQSVPAIFDSSSTALE